MRILKTRPRLTFVLLTFALAAAFAVPHYLSRAGATALAPFIDLQEQGLTLTQDGEGLANWDRVTPATLSVNVGGTVRFALLYWNGRDRPCSYDGTTCVFTQPFKDQQMVFNGTPLTGTVIGSETQPVSGGGPILNLGYFADVTSIVSAAGPGNQTFTFSDGNAASNLWRLNGVSLIVAYTDAANSQFYRVLIWDDLDFAYGDDPTPGDPRVTAAVNFNHGTIATARTAELYLVTGGGTAARPDNVTVSNNPTLFNTLDGSAGADWDSDVHTINIPAGVGTTTVQVNSAPPGQNPDGLLWQVAALRVQPIDSTPPSCSIQTVSGPPFQAIHTIQDAGSGLAEILVTKSENADTVVPPFTVGTTDPVVVTSTKIDQSKPMCVEIRVTDLAGNVGFCDYCEGLIITKAFGAPSILVGSTTTLTFTITNSTGTAAADVAFTDVLPAGLTVPNFSGTNCGGTVTTTAPNTISLSGATVPAGMTCTTTVTVTGATPGVKNNTTSEVTSSSVSKAPPAMASITVVAPPSVAKSFNPATINPGTTSQLTLTISNPADNPMLTDLAVSDSFPAGLTVAATPGLVNTCGGMVTGAVAGSGSISLINGALSPGASSCQVKINVTSTNVGTVINTTSAVTATSGGIALTGNAASASLTATCPSIVVYPASLPGGTVGTAYNQTVSASPAGTYSYAVTTNVLPPGLTLNSTTGALTGTPTAAGNYTFSITATGWGSCTKSQSYNLLISGTCPTITVNPTSLPGGTLGAAYPTTIVNATGGVAPYTFAVTQGALPSGLVLNATTGEVTGTPTTTGTFSFRITATGQGGCAGSRVYVISVACSALTFNPAALPNGAKGVAYNQAITVTPGTGFSFSVLLGSLPPGYTLSSTGVLSGITNQAGSWTFTVKAVQGNCQATKQYTLTIP